MLATRPLVSVVMAMRNAGPTLPAALDSLLGQDYPHWELLLLDDGSTDESVRIAERIGDARIRVIADGEHRGLAVRLNQAVDAARGELIARMDADDVCYPERFSRQLEHLREHPEVDLVASAAVVFARDGEPVGLFAVRTAHPEICARPWAGFYLPHPTWMGRSAWFRAFRYDPQAFKAQDQGLLLRAYTSSRFAAIAEPLLGYRQDAIPLRKVLVSRYHFSRALARSRPRYALRGVLGQAVKALFDTVAITTGLERTLLRHRARPLARHQLDRWREVWRSVNESRAGREQKEPA